MTPENSYLVDYVLGTVPADSHPYTAGSGWADPSLDHAAQLMRRVYEARGEAQAKGARAKSDIVTKHGLETSAAVVLQRVESIRRSRSQVVISRSAGDTSPRAEARPASVAPPGSSPPRLRALSTDTLFRAVRLYRRRQQDRARLADGLREVGAIAARAAALESHQRQALEAVWNALHEMEAALRQQRSAIDRLDGVVQTDRCNAREERETARVHQRQTLEAVWHAVHTSEAAQREHQSAIDALEATHREQQSTIDVIGAAADQDRIQSHLVREEARKRTDALEGRLVATSQAMSELRDDAANQVSTLRQQIGSVESRATRLADRLYAVPYMADPERFHFVDEGGHRRLGFGSCSSEVRDGYRSFEDIFRGSESLIRERQRVYVPLLRDCDGVVDIGCGRGELLDLLREAGVTAIGIDANAGMVAHVRAKGHAVEHADGLAFLKGRPGASLGAIFSAQVVEHLVYDDLMSFLTMSRAKLKPGGRLVFETVNPHAIEAFKTFWTDLTHVRPIFPEVALAWCWLAGFERAEVMFPHGGGDLEEDRRTQGDYAVIATR